MYIPEYFRITDQSIIEKFIRKTGLATVISKGDAFPFATHIPLKLEKNEAGEKVLVGHLSNANEQLKDFMKSPSVLAIFLSPLNGYISSSWYFHENVPTWNYLSVHVSGTLKILDEKRLWETVGRLTDRYEKDSEHPVSLYKLSEKTQRQMKAITGIEIKVEKVEASFKLSQNRNDRDFENVLKQLRLKNDPLINELADVMEAVRNGKY